MSKGSASEHGSVESQSLMSTIEDLPLKADDGRELALIRRTVSKATRENRSFGDGLHSYFLTHAVDGLCELVFLRRCCTEPCEVMDNLLIQLNDLHDVYCGGSRLRGWVVPI